MFKKYVFLLLFILPLNVFADNKYQITNHLIDAEIEIAGALRVKELIIVKGNTNMISRTLNYQSFADEKKDNILNNGSIYNAQSIESVKVSAFEVKNTIDFSTFSENIESYFAEFNFEDIKPKTYSVVKKSGSNTYNIFYDVKNEEVAFYLEYIVSNVIVVHNDINELNYTFKNLNLGAESTLLRLIIPYQTKSELYNFWVHGPSNGLVQELESPSKDKAGFIANFNNLNENVNIRVTLPLEQVSINIYLKHSKIDALSTIKSIEQKKIDNQNISNNFAVVLKWMLIVFGVIYIFASLILFKYQSKAINIIYILLGSIITIFNYYFKFNILFLYFILLAPTIILFISKKLKK